MADFAAGNSPILGSVAIATNPTSGTVMADSGAVPYTDNYECRVVLSQSAAAAFSFARRNVTNSADVVPFPMVLYGAAGQSSEYVILVRLEKDERVRVTMAANLTGQAQVLIQVEQRC